MSPRRPCLAAALLCTCLVAGPTRAAPSKAADREALKKTLLDLAQLEPAQERRFRATKKAWEWFEAQPKGYRTNAVYWMASAKKPETRERRLDRLIEDSARGRRVPPLRPRTGRR